MKVTVWSLEINF